MASTSNFQVIIGFDFIYKNRIVIDIRKNRLSTNEFHVALLNALVNVHETNNVMHVENFDTLSTVKGICLANKLCLEPHADTWIAISSDLFSSIKS